MERLLIFIKHNLKPLWKIIDFINGGVFYIVYKTKLEGIYSSVLGSIESEDYAFRRLLPSDMEALFRLISLQPEEDLKYFNPHGFDLKSLKKQNRVPTFLMMGAFRGEELAGYFFLRFFANRKCFVGRLIDKDHRGRGIGETMNSIMYEIAWRMNFRCLSTVSKDNLAVIKAHSKNKYMIVLKELKNNYVLIEFVKNPSGNPKGR